MKIYETKIWDEAAANLWTPELVEGWTIPHGCSPHSPALCHACGLLKCHMQFFVVLSYHVDPSFLWSFCSMYIDVVCYQCLCTWNQKDNKVLPVHTNKYVHSSFWCHFEEHDHCMRHLPRRVNFIWATIAFPPRPGDFSVGAGYVEGPWRCAETTT